MRRALRRNLYRVGDSKCCPLRQEGRPDEKGIETIDENPHCSHNCHRQEGRPDEKGIETVTRLSWALR